MADEKAMVALDWFVRSFFPNWFDGCDPRYAEQTQLLRSLPEITDLKSFGAVEVLLHWLHKEAGGQEAARLGVAMGFTMEVAYGDELDSAYQFVTSFQIPEENDALLNQVVKVACAVAWTLAMEVARTGVSKSDAEKKAVREKLRASTEEIMKRVWP